jgi:hypothetical protein
MTLIATNIFAPLRSDGSLDLNPSAIGCGICVSIGSTIY